MKLSRKICDCAQSPIRKFYPYAVAAQQRGIRIHQLNIGQPDIQTPPAFFEAIEAGRRDVLAYAESPGIPALLEAIRAYYARIGASFETQDILVTTGGSEALLMAMLCILDEGDEVLIPEPYYPNYFTFIRMAGGRVHPIPTSPEDGYRYAERARIEPHITEKTRAILLSNPGNPTGTVLTPAELRLMADIAREHGLYLICDEVYREFINMAWHNVTNQDANNAVAQRIAQTKGLTTLAPTWIHVADTNGNISSIASADYVSYAHKQNVEVWMTVRDFDGGISSEQESYELLSYTSRRETLITQLIAEALRVGVDGINVDFEKISDKCGEHYIEFIRELSVKCRQNGLVLSVDNYVPKSFNTQYDRKEQGIVADYVVIMGYDEYYAGSPEAGPVSSYNYVKEGITETLKEVPAEKVISGIPFFTRLWKETPKTEEELKSDKGTDAEQYSTTVESDAYGMDNAQAIVKQAGVDTTWDKKAGQNYATWEADGSKYEIWLEDSKSIEAKLKLMKKYKLAGTAEWSLGQESSDIWNLIQKYVN